MVEILIAIIQFVFELVIEVLGSSCTWPFSSKKFPKRKSIAGIVFLWVLAGSFLGWVWAFFVPVFYLTSPLIRLVNLMIAPVLSAEIGYYMAGCRKKDNASINPQHHYWYSLWFTFGLVAVRFVYTVIFIGSK